MPSIDSGDHAISTKGERLTHGWLREAPVSVMAIFTNQHWSEQGGTEHT